jgi:hypothetical protein
MVKRILDGMVETEGKNMILAIEICVGLLMLYILWVFVMMMKNNATLYVITWFSENTNLVNHLPPYFEMMYDLGRWSIEGWMKWLKERGIA